MNLWIPWWNLIEQLRPACSRNRTFIWMSIVLIGFVIRPDLLGVTSIIRAIGLQAWYYDRLLDFFHSSALGLSALTGCWVSIVLDHFPLIRCNGRIVLIGDGLKVAKSGKKMPGVKKLHQESESNTKPTYIFGHSCQALAVVVGSAASMLAVPLLARIHEGVRFSNRDHRTLLDKMVDILLSQALQYPYYIVVDSYYAARKPIRAVLQSCNHLISRVRRNAVAYEPAVKKTKRGRGAPKKYGKKIALRCLFDDRRAMQQVQSRLYDDEKDVNLLYRSMDLLWRSAGQLVRFVAVAHPSRGRVILMSTDITLTPMQIIELYAMRFKIEVSFKQALRTVGAFAYHFWMAGMKRIKRSGRTQYLHRESDEYRAEVVRKIDAYHRFIQLGQIAHGSLQYLSCRFSEVVWKHFGSWIRTVRPGIVPSEMVTKNALRNTVIDFFAVFSKTNTIIQFILKRIDVDRAEGARFVA